MIDNGAREVVLRFRIEAEVFPFNFEAMRGGWHVSPAPQGSAVDIWWSVTPDNRRFGWLIFAIAAIAPDRHMPRLIAAMEAGGVESMRRPATVLLELVYY